VRFWFDDALRLEAAKAIQRARLGRIANHWIGNRKLADFGFEIPADRLKSALMHPCGRSTRRRTTRLC
jgi:CRISPR-associated protein Cas1